jgi:E3 ubiquitin-protein ligase RFWD2
MNAGAAEDVDSICSCPICVETIQDAFVTPCGHTFCYKCISTHLKNKSNCPSCGAHLVQDHIHPNFLLSKVRNNNSSSSASSLQGPYSSATPHHRSSCLAS